MLLHQRSNHDCRRRGVILLVVLFLLTLFAIVGISFVLYANAEATASRISKEAEIVFLPNIDPELALSIFLNQLIYDVPDDAIGVYSALRGQSLSRNLYGWNPSGLNDKPYTGTGKLHYPSPFNGQTGVSSFASDDSYYVNFTYFSGDSFLRDPERYASPPRTDLTKPQGVYAGGFNVPYTYPDHQNFFLGMISSANGQVLVPSFHRSWLFGSLYDTTNPTNPQNNPYWGNVPGTPAAVIAAGKYLTLRPRPVDMQVPGGPPTQFPYPTDPGGDVKNLDSAPGGNDSTWIDIGAPVMMAPNGQKYKMLVAPLILELDSRINLNVAGNILGTSDVHASDAGWMGTSAINISKVLNSSILAKEWANILVGNLSTTAPGAVGRYGSGGLPQGTPLLFGTYPRQYSQIDFNALQGVAPGNLVASQMQLPPYTATTSPAAYPYQCFPGFPTGYNFGSTVATQLTNSPLLYDSQRPGTLNRQLPLSSLAALLRYGGTNSEALTSDLLRLCPQNLILDNTSGTSPMKRRNMVTLHSADLDRPGATPYIFDPSDATTSYQFNTTLNSNNVAGNTSYGLWFPNFPQPQAISFPTPANPLPKPTTPGEFDPITWRSTLGQQLRVNLNRPLTSYPPPYQYPYTYGVAGAGKLTRFTAAAAKQAIQDRVQLATDVFTALRKAVGALPAPPDPAAPTVGTPNYNALRWLAQLAVNIVDFIDEDDINTPFRWDTTNTTLGDNGYVFGTELPRLVINEAFIQLDNDPNDPGVINKTGAKYYNVNTWVELCNPLIAEPSGGDSANQAVLDDGLDPAKYSIYQLVITDPTQPPAGAFGNIRLLHMRDPGNVVGDPSYPAAGPNYGTAAGTNVMTYGAATGPCVINAQNNGNGWGVNAVVMPLNNAYSGPIANNQGFYVIGPPPTNSLTQTNLPMTLTSQAMTYRVSTEPAGSVPNPATLGTSPPPAPTILLQRLACPALPFNNNPADFAFNPYITVDYYEAWQKAMVFDSRKFNAAGKAPATGVQVYAAWGRNQPYTAATLQWSQQNNVLPNLPPSANGTQVPKPPFNTFFYQNALEKPPAAGQPPPSTATLCSGAQLRFDWLVHLDRQLISPMELLHVSGFKPHELTQQFYDPVTGNAFSHYAPWTNNNYNPSATTTNVNQQSRLYRVFELLETASRANGVSMGGRVPGKININMIQDAEVVDALVDAQLGNWYTQSTAESLIVSSSIPNWISLIQQRTPNKGIPGSNDQPFWSLATGFSNGGDALDPNTLVNPGSPNQRGILDTLLRNNGMSNDPNNPVAGLALDWSAVPGVTVPQPGHPYQRFQLLTKIFNNLTTRSNVFAVWVTVGFFEVAKDLSGNYVGDQYLPVKLGAEIGRAEGRHIRHRMFAIVDRSNLQVFSTSCSTAITAATAPYSPQTVTLGTIVPTNPNGTVPSLQAGMVLVFDANTDNEETVVVQSASGNQITAIFLRAHNAGAQVIQRGNPGPWMMSQSNMLRYDPRLDPLVVPYFAIID